MHDIFTGGSAVCVLSGGLDSTIATIMATRAYGHQKVHALSFFYGQKQSRELNLAKKTCERFNIKHTLVDISFLGKMVAGVSANIADGGLAMPTITDILGDPQPVTYVPNRNAILLNIAASYAEANELENVITGLQSQDTYGYWDTTPEFVASINQVWSQNRMNKVKLLAPFMGKNKLYEIQLLIDTFGVENASIYLKNTLTCYDPTPEGFSCGVCPSCAERIQAFKQAGISDPVSYAINIDWK